jgi:outer membrane protein assembly factor BamE (lipoprotein component of BamABCDE complex)
MTNEMRMIETSAKNRDNRSSFEPGHSSVVRPWSFAIFSTARLVLLLLFVLGASCSGKRITGANVDQVAEGMSKKQVESILGPPSSINNEKTTYVYRQGKDTVTIVFKDDKVQAKDSTLTR